MTSKYLSMMTAITAGVATWLTSMTIKSEKTIMVDWTMMKFMSTEFNVKMTANAKSMAFAACVMLITTAVMVYSNYYMHESKKKNAFMKMIMAFITSMMVLIFSNNMITLILGWEGLGMTSFVLIMFYQNKKSLNSGFYTMMMNRVGDIMLMMSMVYMMTQNSWMFESAMFSSQKKILTMMMIAAFSKSAQLPFSSWLTEAMAAPTPISALVHSSTLVTAGVFMFMRFESALKYSQIKWLIFSVSMTTLIMASMNSITEWDIKKIVALSTLSQMSMMFITISMNMFNLAFFHLLVHATFKALIFLCSSSFISFSNTQDIRKMNKLSSKMFMTKMSFNTATLTLCGFPFLSSFYSKEMIMETMVISKMNTIAAMTFYACMTCTLFYSMKSVIFLNMNKSNQPTAPLKEQKEQKMSSMMLLIPAVSFGNKMNWVMNISFKIPHMTTTEKTIPIMMMVFVAITAKEMKTHNSQKKMKNKKMIMMTNYMWFTKNLSLQIKKMAVTGFFSITKNTEKVIFPKIIKAMKTTISNASLKNLFIGHKSFNKTAMILMMTAMLML